MASRPSGASAQFYPRNSHYSTGGVAPSTYSWVPNSHSNPSGQTSLPPPRPHPFQSTSHPASRPLPNPHPLQKQLQLVDHDIEPMKPGGKKFMNNAPAGPNNYVQNFDMSKPPLSNNSASPGPKKKTLVGGFVKGIRRLPKVVFGSGNRPANRHDILQNDITSTNTLPMYTSNPTTPVTGLGQSTYYRQPMVLSDPSVDESRTPPPEVLRVDDSRPMITVSQYEDQIHGPSFDEQGRQLSNSAYNYANEGYGGTPADRTTVMVYSHSNDPEVDDHAPPSHPLPTVARQISSPGLSYASSDPPAGLRPASLHSTHTMVPPLVIPQPRRVPVPSSGLRVSYASQATIPVRASTPHSSVPGAFPGSSPPRTQEPPLPQTVQNDVVHSEAPAHTVPPPIEPIQSPVSVHAEPTDDYMKMAASPPTSHATFSTTTTSYEPSFSSELNPVEKFFKTLYNMPWISHARVTVDYAPGEGLGKMKKRKTKPSTSWYRTMTSRRSSASLDLLSNGTISSRRTSLSASIGLAFGSPLAGSRRSKPLSEVNGSMHHKSSRNGHGSSRHHHRHHHRHHGSHGHRRRRRDTATTTDTEYDKGPSGLAMKSLSSPMVPPPYPFQFPFHYPTFSSFPMAMAASPASKDLQQQQQQQPQAGRNENPQGDQANSPRGPRTGTDLQPQLIYAPAGYTPYQPMLATPQMYMFQPQAAAGPSQGVHLTHAASSGFPGGVADASAAAHPAGTNSPRVHDQHQPSSTPLRGQNIPGSFI
ncbi:hypothetical protein CPC08DRAFT_462663 [Agrocybe pediades]|nr:hypothetical protein CPC08DRAFT_462663 [Agrocybe pediades]